MRTPQALAAIEAMATACPELMVGAGTVLNAEHARQVRDAGGCFMVSPGATDALIQGCADADLPLLPGASSVSEVMRLGEKGFFMLKFFPATAAGGLPFIKALASATTIPVLSNRRHYACDGNRLAGTGKYSRLGGSWIAP